MAISKVNFNSLNVTPTASKVLKFNSSNDGLEAGDVGGALVLISEQTASSSSTISFTSGIDSTYKEYVFKFINIHPSADWSNWFAFQTSTNSGSSYGVTVTNTTFRPYNNEADSQTGLSYLDSYDQAQNTDFIRLCEDTSAANADENLSGELKLFNPSSTTFVKHYLGRSQTAVAKVGQVYSADWHGGGYFNTTSAIDAVQFKFNSGNTDSGTIKMYGVT